MPRPVFLLLFVPAAVLGFQLTAQPPRFDVVIRDGRVMDGSGNPWIRADVGIRGGRIAAVGELDQADAVTIVDASNLVVAPGFLDVHSHAAEGLANPKLRHARPLVAQGVTTVVINPDGGGPTDLVAQRRKLENGGIGVNVAQLIGQGAVRGAVLGEASRAPNEEELGRMIALVRAAMDAGAFGLSSGLFYTPGSYASTEEVIALAAVAGETGGVYTSHIRDEADYSIGVVAAVSEVIRIAEESGAIGIVSHMKALGPDNWGLSHALTARIDAARDRGVQVFADQYPYEASSTSLRAALLPGDPELPSAEALETPAADLTPAAREALAKIESVVRENIRRRGGARAIQIASYGPDPSIQGRTLEAVAEARQQPPERTALQLLAKGNVSIVSFNMSEDDIRHIMTRPYTMASSDAGLTLPSDARPHPRNNGAFARRLAVYVRERGVVTLEFAIRSMTSLPAMVFGMRDRGVIREGAAADLVIFDPALVRDTATYTDPHRLAEGMSWVFVNGKAAVADGKFTDVLAGQVLRFQGRRPVREP